MTNNDTNSPLFDCESLPKLGGFVRLRLCYSQDILQQLYQSESELDEIIFLRKNIWLADWTYADRFSGELKIEGSLADFGLEEKYNFKAMLEVDCEPKDFKIWFNRVLRGRRVCLELTSANDFVRIMNPFMVGYTYMGTPNFENMNRYELIFTRANYVENLATVTKNRIQNVVIDCDASEDYPIPIENNEILPVFIGIINSE
jgi:hypothetical protein